MSKRKRTKEYKGREITYMVEFHNLQSISLNYPCRYGIEIYLENAKKLHEKEIAHIMVDLFYKLLDSSIEEIQNMLNIRFENGDILSKSGERISQVSIHIEPKQKNDFNKVYITNKNEYDDKNIEKRIPRKLNRKYLKPEGKNNE